MAHYGSNGNRSGKWEGGVESRKYAPDSAWVWRMSGLTRDETAERNSRDQSLRRERGQGKFIFPAQLITSRIGNHTRLMPSLLKATKLIESGEVDLDAGDNGGQRPIHVACFKDHVGIVKRLVEAGADATKADKAGNTPLHAAAATGALQVLQYLLVDKGLPCDTRNLEGLTPLTLAERECSPRNKLAVLRLLREHGKEGGAEEDANRGGMEQEGRIGKDWPSMAGARANGNRTSLESQAAAAAAEAASLKGLPDQEKETVAALYRALRRQQKTIDALAEVVQIQARTIADLVAATTTPATAEPTREARKVVPYDDADTMAEIAAYSEELGKDGVSNRTDDPAQREGDR